MTDVQSPVPQPVRCSRSGTNRFYSLEKKQWRLASAIFVELPVLGWGNIWRFGVDPGEGKFFWRRGSTLAGCNAAEFTFPIVISSSIYSLEIICIISNLQLLLGIFKPYTFAMFVILTNISMEY